MGEGRSSQTVRLFTDVVTRIDDPYLARAFQLAAEARGKTSPNPMVGCVLVREGRIVGEGFHERAGAPHAEAVALARAGELARGSVAYVTLEPCDHHGRTPPCSLALIDAGVTRVVIGMADPSALASGGAGRLRTAGIDVEYAADPTPFEELNESWLHYESEGRPYVHVKLAVTLDARLAAFPGVRTRISGSEATGLTMRMRSTADAVLVGASTASVDAPSLTVRDPAGKVLPASSQPLRVVLGRSFMPDAALFGDGFGRAIALAPDGVGIPGDIDVLRYASSGDPEGDLLAALGVLAEAEGVRRVLVEPGPKLFTTLANAGLIDELTLIHNGSLFGSDAPDLFVGYRAGRSGPRFDVFEVGMAGTDAVSAWRPVRGEGETICSLV